MSSTVSSNPYPRHYVASRYNRAIWFSLAVVVSAWAFYFVLLCATVPLALAELGVSAWLLVWNTTKIPRKWVVVLALAGAGTTSVAYPLSMIVLLRPQALPRRVTIAGPILLSTTLVVLWSITALCLTLDRPHAHILYVAESLGWALCALSVLSVVYFVLVIEATIRAVDRPPAALGTSTKESRELGLESHPAIDPAMFGSPVLRA